MKLAVKEDFHPGSGRHLEESRSAGGEEFQTDLEHAHFVLEQFY
ncbi:MAG: hypothetical protein BWY75_03171 [bacterium ADurb.Bin425]|nr:MAG: hypothetical protein BWY75_03171 [bacterium ADurb.Bin425]